MRNVYTLADQFAHDRLGTLRRHIPERVPRRNETKPAPKLRSNVHADRYVVAVVLAVGNIGIGVDFEFAFDGGVLIDDEGHGLGAGSILCQLVPRCRVTCPHG
jgi:hypothetical protein